MKGKFITFEGADGGGKSTQVQLAAAWLREQGYEVVTTREPGGTVLAEKVRELVLDPNLPLNSTSQSLLYLAARSEHVEKVMLTGCQIATIPTKVLAQMINHQLTDKGLAQFMADYQNSLK